MAKRKQGSFHVPLIVTLVAILLSAHTLYTRLLLNHRLEEKQGLEDVLNRQTALQQRLKKLYREGLMASSLEKELQGWASQQKPLEMLRHFSNAPDLRMTYFHLASPPLTRPLPDAQRSDFFKQATAFAGYVHIDLLENTDTGRSRFSQFYDDTIQQYGTIFRLVEQEIEEGAEPLSSETPIRLSGTLPTTLAWPNPETGND